MTAYRLHLDNGKKLRVPIEVEVTRVLDGQSTEITSPDKIITEDLILYQGHRHRVKRVEKINDQSVPARKDKKS